MSSFYNDYWAGISCFLGAVIQWKKKIASTLSGNTRNRYERTDSTHLILDPVKALPLSFYSVLMKKYRLKIKNVKSLKINYICVDGRIQFFHVIRTILKVEGGLADISENQNVIGYIPPKKV